VNSDRSKLDLSQPRTVADIFATALSLYRRHALLLLGLALMVVAPFEVIVLALTTNALVHHHSTSLGTVVILLLVEFALISPLVSALYVHALLGIANGERPSFGGVLLAGLRVLPVVAAAQIVAGIAIVVGFALFIIPGIYVTVRLIVVAQAAAIERTDWPGALRRSLELTSQNFWRICGLALVDYLVNITLSRLVGSSDDIVVAIAVATLAQSFLAITYAILYFDLRARHSAG
jgi:hypothetical protein